MLRSMTGYGVAEGPVSGGRLQVEIRSVNHRFFNLHVRLPASLQPLEGTLRDRLKERIDRGHVSVTARWLESPSRALGFQLDLDRARGLRDAFLELKQRLDLAGEVDVALLARQPNVITPPEEASAETGEAGDAEQAAGVMGVVDAALEQVVELREREGAALRQELLRRFDLLDDAKGSVERRAPERRKAETERLSAALGELIGDRKVDADRVAHEVAIYADRVDITEELVRLAAHLHAAREAVETGGPKGKMLGFLSQEMLREINTMGSKANDSEIAAQVINMKGELEKIREQLENVE